MGPTWPEYNNCFLSLGPREDCVGMAELWQNNPFYREVPALCCVSPHGLMRLWSHHDMNIFRLEMSFCWGLVCQLCPYSLSLRDQGNSWWYTANMTSHAFSARHTMSWYITEAGLQGCGFIVMSVNVASHVCFDVNELGVHSCHDNDGMYRVLVCLFQQWYTSTMNLLGTWLTDRMDLQLHVYQLKILIRIVKVWTAAIYISKHRV